MKSPEFGLAVLFAIALVYTVAGKATAAYADASVCIYEGTSYGPNSQACMLHHVFICEAQYIGGPLAWQPYITGPGLGLQVTC